MLVIKLAYTKVKNILHHKIKEVHVILYDNKSYYYMATTVCALWLAAERALFSCKDRGIVNFFLLNDSFELWVKLRARGRKHQKRWTKDNYIFNNWKKN